MPINGKKKLGNVGLKIIGAARSLKEKANLIFQIPYQEE